MDPKVIEAIRQIGERASADPRAAIGEFAKLASNCAERGQTDEEGICLWSAVQAGTSQDLSAEAIPVCIRLVTLQPRKLYIRHLAILHELAGNVEHALRIYRWIAAVSVEANDGVALRDIEQVIDLGVSGVGGRRSLLTTDEKELVAHLDLAQAYLEMGLFDDAARQVEEVLHTSPHHALAADLKARIEVQKKASR